MKHLLKGGPDKRYLITLNLLLADSDLWYLLRFERERPQIEREIISVLPFFRLMAKTKDHCVEVVTG